MHISITEPGPISVPFSSGFRNQRNDINKVIYLVGGATVRADQSESRI